MVFIYAGPVVLDPVFNKFTPLKQGQVRSDVLALARQAGVKVDKVYEVDASRRTTAANAYVTGLGSTKRVVLYDTLTDDFSRDELRLVVAHELGHVHYNDVPRGLLWLALVAPASLFAVQRMTERLSPGRDAGSRDAARARAVHRRGVAAGRHRLQPALPARRGEGRQLRADDDRGARAVHRLRATDRDPERRPTPIRRGS